MSTTRGGDDIGLSGAVWLNKDHHKFLGGDRIRLLEKIDEIGSITQAAKAVGISYKTAWEIVNLVNNLADKPLVDRMAGGKGGGGTTLTPEGKSVIRQYQVIQEEHRKFLDNLTDRLDDVEGLYKLLRMISMRVSARNVFMGTIDSITRGVVNSEVDLALKGGAKISATITNCAVDNLGLEPGRDAYAIIKASSVIVGTDLTDVRVSARNLMCGTVVKIIEGPVTTEVDVEVAGGTTVSAVITHESSNILGLKVGGDACVLFKASSVILGVS